MDGYLKCLVGSKCLIARNHLMLLVCISALASHVLRGLYGGSDVAFVIHMKVAQIVPKLFDEMPKENPEIPPMLSKTRCLFLYEANRVM